MMNKAKDIELIPRRAYATVLMLIGSIVISFGGLVIRNINTADTWQINFYRSLAFSMAILIFLLFRYGKTAPTKLLDIGLQGVLAAALFAFANISFLQAITNTTVAATTFTMGSIPFLTAFIAWLFLNESIGKSTFFTMLAATVGIFLMFVKGLDSGSVYGNSMAFLGAIGFSGYAAIIRRNREQEMTPTLILANLMIISLALFFRWDDLLVSVNDLILCFVLGGLLSATVNTLFVIAAKHLLAAELTLFMLLEFTLAPLWVWVFINEVPTSWTLIGGGVVIFAVLFKSGSELRQDNS